MSTQILFTVVHAVDCGRYSSERSRPECEEAAQNFMGILAFAAVLILAIGFVAWRLWLKKARRRDGQ